MTPVTFTAEFSLVSAIVHAIDPDAVTFNARRGLNDIW